MAKKTKLTASKLIEHYMNYTLEHGQHPKSVYKFMKDLDREEQDFSLEVTSAGATSPLVLPRQYKKHIGRNLEVKTNDDQKLEGELTEADDERIVLKWKTREPKPVGKGKVTVTKEVAVIYDNVKQAKVKIKF